MMVSTTPDTYSGVDVVAIEITDRRRGRCATLAHAGHDADRERDRHHDRQHPEHKSPVASSAGPSLSTTLTLNLVEQPRSP